MERIKDSGLGFASSRGSSSKNTEFFRSNSSKSCLRECLMDSFPLPDTIEGLNGNLFSSFSVRDLSSMTTSFSIRPDSEN